MARIRHTGGHGSILTAKGGSGAGVVPAFVAATSTNVSNGTITLTKPTGTLNDDLMVVFCKHAWGAYFKTPTGWRHIGIDGSGIYGGETLAKVAASEGSSFAITNVGANGATNAILASFRGRTQLGDLRELPDIQTHATSTITTNSRIASRKGLFLLYACSHDVSGSYIPAGPPAGMIQRHTHIGSGNSYLYTQVVEKGDDLSRAMVWGAGTQPITIAMLL